MTASKLRTRLQHIDAEIARLELSLQSLQEARTSVLEELRLLGEPSSEPIDISSLRVAYYPVLSLPFEITSQIFLHCLPEDIRPYPSLDDAPLVLTRVCRDWRTVAISTSTLWDQVSIELDSDDNPGHIDSKWVALLDLWLQRSHPQPLSLTVSNRSYTKPDETLLAVLDRHSRRCRNITIKLPFHQFSRLEEHASLPWLEKLTLSAHGAPNIINPISTFRHAPMLRHVCFEAGIVPSEVNLPWTQLTSVEFYGARADDCLELLELTPNIVNCVFDVQYDSHAVALGSPLKDLRSFTFSGPAGWGLLRYIAMPTLQTLDLSRCPLDPRNIAQIINFVRRSECQLRSLRIYVRSAVVAQTIWLLRFLSSLTAVDLILAGADTGTTIFEEFLKSTSGEKRTFLFGVDTGTTTIFQESVKSGDSSRIILPRVETISVHCIHDDNHELVELMFDVITDALQSREGAVNSFALSLDGDTPAPGPETRQRWQELSDKGMRMRVENSRERWI
ncbi:hypothetical protein B0H12DRAFT_1110138 [Mycena haematopus]|nr:hypothetical protein B0H12DRAFT_1110138 [Mycena haematopus]